jgi:hypothetical protein
MDEERNRPVGGGRAHQLIIPKTDITLGCVPASLNDKSSDSHKRAVDWQSVRVPVSTQPPAAWPSAAASSPPPPQPAAAPGGAGWPMVFRGWSGSRAPGANRRPCPCLVAAVLACMAAHAGRRSERASARCCCGGLPAASCHAPFSGNSHGPGHGAVQAPSARPDGTRLRAPLVSCQRLPGARVVAPPAVLQETPHCVCLWILLRGCKSMQGHGVRGAFRERVRPRCVVAGGLLPWRDEGACCKKRSGSRTLGSTCCAAGRRFHSSRASSLQKRVGGVEAARSACSGSAKAAGAAQDYHERGNGLRPRLRGGSAHRLLL